MFLCNWAVRTVHYFNVIVCCSCVVVTMVLYTVFVVADCDGFFV